MQETINIIFNQKKRKPVMNRKLDIFFLLEQLKGFENKYCQKSRKIFDNSEKNCCFCIYAGQSNDLSGNCQAQIDIYNFFQQQQKRYTKKLQMNSSGLYLHKGIFVQSKTHKVTDDYLVGKQLGKGAYGTVYAAKSKISEKLRAIKQIKKSSIRNPAQFVNQLEILKKVDHPNIIKIYETYEDQNNYYVVTDFCQGGELFDRLIEKGSFSELQARQIFRQMLYAIKYCHGEKVAHRDLKPQNFLFLNKQSSSLKLIDFGLSYNWKQCMRSELKAKGQNKLVGTSYYIAPDILKGDYCEKCDIWSLGVILYILVTAVPPFDGENDRKILESVKRGIYTFDIPQMKKISSELKDLISKILQPEDKRYTIDQILKHPWMNSNLSKTDLKINFNKLKRFSRYCHLKKFSASCIASQLTGKQIEQLGKMFKEVDTDLDGFITAQELKNALEKQKQQISMSDAQKLIEYIDLDKNGKINYSEFIACCAESSLLLREENLRFVFKSLDADGDGKISQEELKKGFNIGHYSVDEESISSIVKQCDKNGDGKIDFKEFVAVVSQL